MWVTVFLHTTYLSASMHWSVIMLIVRCSSTCSFAPAVSAWSFSIVGGFWDQLYLPICFPSIILSIQNSCSLVHRSFERFAEFCNGGFCSYLSTILFIHCSTTLSKKKVSLRSKVKMKLKWHSNCCCYFLCFVNVIVLLREIGMLCLGPEIASICHSSPLRLPSS